MRDGILRTALAAAVLLGAGAAPAQTVTVQPLRAEGLELMDPCALETLVPAGVLQVETVSREEGDGTVVEVRVDPERLIAVGQGSGREFEVPESASTEIAVGEAPSGGYAAVDLRFASPDEERAFHARVVFRVQVLQGGAAVAEVVQVIPSCR